MDVASCARDEGVGGGTFVRWLTLRHLAALKKAGVTTAVALRADRDIDPVKLGSHISLWLTDDEYALLRRLAAAIGLTVSGYLGRCVVERWLLARRKRLASTPGTTKRPHMP
jgi:hypothetical protein